MIPVFYRKRRRQPINLDLVSPTMLRLAIIASISGVVQGQFSFCTPLPSENWAGLEEAIKGSFRLAVLCPFRIEGDGCPSLDEAPKGLVFGNGGIEDIMFVECDPNLSDRFEDSNSQCIIDCPGRHFTVAPSSSGLIITNMVLKGATDSSILVESGGQLEVVNTLFSK